MQSRPATAASMISRCPERNAAYPNVFFSSSSTAASRAWASANECFLSASRSSVVNESGSRRHVSHRLRRRCADNDAVAALLRIDYCEPQTSLTHLSRIVPMKDVATYSPRGYPHIEKGGVKRCRPPLSCVRESTCPSHAFARSDGPTWFGSHALREISVPDGAGRGERLNRQLHLSWIQEVGTAPAPSLRKRRSEGGQRFGNPSNHLRKPCRSGPLVCAMTEREQAAHPKCGYFLLTGTGVREGRSRRAYHGAPKGALCGYGSTRSGSVPWYVFTFPFVHC